MSTSTPTTHPSTPGIPTATIGSTGATFTPFPTTASPIRTSSSTPISTPISLSNIPLYDPNTPPPPPPKTASTSASPRVTGISSAAVAAGGIASINGPGLGGGAGNFGSPPPPPPPPPPHYQGTGAEGLNLHSQSQSPAVPVPGIETGGGFSTSMDSSSAVLEPVKMQDEGWLPEGVKERTKPSLQHILSTPALLDALIHSPATIHPSLSSTNTAVSTQLSTNITLASHLVQLESAVRALREHTQTKLLAARGLEQAWRGKQRDMDAALEPWSPKALYVRLGQATAEQEAVCRALEESFLEGETGAGGGGGVGNNGTGDGEVGVATEREVVDFLKRYREARRLAYLRRERKERWDEGRVGGWR